VVVVVVPVRLVVVVVDGPVDTVVVDEPIDVPLLAEPPLRAAAVADAASTRPAAPSGSHFRKLGTVALR